MLERSVENGTIVNEDSFSESFIRRVDKGGEGTREIERTLDRQGSSRHLSDASSLSLSSHQVVSGECDHSHLLTRSSNAFTRLTKAANSLPISAFLPEAVSTLETALFASS